MAGFEWGEKQNEAAEFVAAGDLAYETIALNIGITARTLWNWRQAPEFIARVDELREAHRQEILGRGVAHKHKRVQKLNDMWYRLQRVIEARADDATMQGVPGGSTGLLVRTTKMIGTGENATVIDEYTVDTATLKELRDTAKQAAIELGQWQEKLEMQTPNIKTEDLRVPDIAPHLIAEALAIAAKHTVAVVTVAGEVDQAERAV